MDVDVLQWLDDLDTTLPQTKVQSTPSQTLTQHITTGTSFEISREVLLHLLEKAVVAIPARDMVPVLLNFQFIVQDSQLKVIASSREMSMVVTTSQVNTIVSGVEVFPAKTLLSIVKEANPGTTVFVEVTSTGAVIVAGSFSVEIKLADGKDFPLMENLQEVDFYEVNRAKFVSAISEVKYALPTRDFSGQASLKMISIKGGKFTACDGARFQQVRIPEFKLNMKLPTFSISTLIKVLSGTDEEILQIGETTNCLVFKMDNLIFYLNKHDDPYPNVEQLWLRPALTNNESLVVSRDELLKAIKQSKTIADSDSNAIALLISADSLEVRCKGIDDTAKVVVSCKWLGKPRIIVVDFTHLSEMLRAYKNPECEFLLGEDTKQRKSLILLKDKETEAIATISQLLTYRAGLV